VKLTVTQEDINNGRPVSAKYCALALALNRELDLDTSSRFASVGIDEAFILGDLEAALTQCIFTLPEAATEFIHRFDSGLKVVPAEFELTRVFGEECPE
jgi:hypothetical protein